MEIKFKQGDRITIPEGCTAVINNGVVVFEKEEREFKDGDILVDDTTLPWFSNKLIMIYKGEKTDDGSYRCYIHLTGSGTFKINSLYCNMKDRKIRHATEVEKQRLFDKMKEHGLRWNAEEKKVEKVRWKPEVDEDYFYVNFYGNVVQTRNIGGYGDYELQKVYNYFPTREQAKKASEAINETLRRFHEENE